MGKNLCKIYSIDEIAANITDVVIESEFIASNAKPGQFLHIDCGDEINNFLRRPISICDVYDNKVRFIFEVKGNGTNRLAAKKRGDILDVLGPLGNGFTVSDEYKQPMIVGGGIGIFPLLNLAKQFDKKAEVFLGFRNKDRLVMENEFKAVSKDVSIVSDDGSCGIKGLVTEPLINRLENGAGDIIYACGPTPMLRAVKTLAEKYKVKCQLSLEQRMGCGIGACLVCSCQTVFTGTKKYKKVCADGPVFWSDEVTLND